MNADNPWLILEHPTLGDLPARRVLACIFALTAEGKILHFHREQTVGGTDPQRYRLSDTPADEGRARCCIIPPTILAFRPPKTP